MIVKFIGCIFTLSKIKLVMLRLIADNGRNEYSRGFWAQYLWPWIQNENWIIPAESFPMGEHLTDEDDHPIDRVDGERATDPETGEPLQFYKEGHLLYVHPYGWDVGLVDGELTAVENGGEVENFTFAEDCF